ncbi:hypothetical protein D3C72_1308750 [compost metagenome]
MRPQEGVEIEITGVIDNNRIPRLQQETAQKIDRLRAGVGEHDLAGARLHPVFGQPARQKLAQRQQSHRAAIIRQQGGVGAGEPAHGSPQCLLRHPRYGKPAATGFGENGTFIQRLPRNPQGIHRPVELRLDIGEREGCKRT